MDLIDVISGIPNRITTVVHAGAGLCKEIGAYEGLGASKVVLLEPHPALFAQLQSRLAANAKTSVRNVALCAVAGETEFHLNQVPRFSSVYLPKGLLDLFPNATAVETRRVEAVTLHQLVSDLAPNSADGESLLVLELNGAEHEVLYSLEEQDLAPFNWIVVHSCKADLFAAPASTATLRSVLDNLGFASFTFRKPNAPFAIEVAQRNNLHAQLEEIEALKLELERVTQALHGARYARQESADEAARLHLELQNKLNDLEAAKNAQLEGLRNALNELETESALKAAQVKKLTESLDEKSQESALEIDRLMKSLDALERDRAAQATTIQELNESLETLTLELNNLRAKHSETVAGLEQAQTEAAERFEIQQAEMLERQYLLDREVLKAEAQLELIKDVLLREKAF